MTRMMALGWPDRSEALSATDQWMLGDNLLVAPIASAGTAASRSVWFPPGQWTDFFTGQTVTGPATRTISTGFDRAPVWIKGGGIVPLAPPMDNVEHRVDPLTLRVAPGASGRSSLYEDAGDGLAYEHGESMRTRLAYAESTSGHRLVIGRARGSYPGAATTRSYVIQFLATDRPAIVTANGRQIAPRSGSSPDSEQDPDLGATDAAIPARDEWSYDTARHIVTVRLTERSVRRPIVVALDRSP
jgi:hypothetical protein